MPRRPKVLDASARLGAAIAHWAAAPGFEKFGKAYDGYDPTYLVECANRPVDAWYLTTVETFRGGQRTLEKIPRFPAATLDDARAVQDHLRRDLTHIVKHGRPFASSLPRSVRLQWWYDDRQRQTTLLAQASDVDIYGYFDWAVLILWLRDAAKLRQCVRLKDGRMGQRCGRFYLVDDERVSGNCGDPKCASTHRRHSVNEAKKRERDREKAGALANGASRKLRRSLGR